MLLGLAGLCRAAEPKADPHIELGSRIERSVSEIRGLEFVRPIRFAPIGKQGVRAYLERLVSEQYAPGELEREGLALEALGLIPPSMDYAAELLAIYTEQVGGYYDPVAETFYLADWLPAGGQEGVIAHEMTHALQDQHFGLDDFVARIRGNSDAMLARAALVEGEATLVTVLYALRARGVELEPAALDLDGPIAAALTALASHSTPLLAEAPRAVRELMLFPYLRGTVFVDAGRKKGGFKRLDAAYGDLPASTEQILHPERYFDERDPPTPVELGFLEGRAQGWERIWDDVLGEFMLRLLLAPAGAADEVIRAAAGWDGDRLSVLKRGRELAWLDLSFWDSPEDATEFAAALARTVLVRRPGFAVQVVGASRLGPSGQRRLARPDAHDHEVAPLRSSSPPRQKDRSAMRSDAVRGETRMTWASESGRSVIIQRRGAWVIAIDGLPLELAEEILRAGLAQLERDSR